MDAPTTDESVRSDTLARAVALSHAAAAMSSTAKASSPRRNQPPTDPVLLGRGGLNASSGGSRAPPLTPTAANSGSPPNKQLLLELASSAPRRPNPKSPASRGMGPFFTDPSDISDIEPDGPGTLSSLSGSVWVLRSDH
jgi:hypothetical protein